MKLKSLYKKVLAVVCAIAMVVATCAGTESFSVKAEALEDIYVDGAVHNYGEVEEHAYNYGWLCGAGSEYQYLIMTYTGDITNLRLQLVNGDERFGETYWVNPEQKSHLALVGEPILTSEEGATIVIDLKATGMDLDKADAMDMHYGPGTLNIGYVRLSQSAEINPEVDVMPEPEETESSEDGSKAETDMNIEGFVGVWAPEAEEGYAYLTGVEVGYSGYGYLQLTYKGDATAFDDLRLEFEGAGTTRGLVNPYDGKLVTVEGTDVPAPTSEEQTVVIDLKKSGVNTDAVLKKLHMHQTAGNGSFEITDAKLLVKYGDDSEEPTGDNTLEDLILNGDENGMSSMMKNFSCSQAYKYLGFATLKEPTVAYKYLILTYAGDISTVRFEFTSVVDGTENTNAKIGPYWFNKDGQTKYFVTADDSDIPLNGGKGTTIVIDLEKSGITLGALNSVHMHGGDPNVASFSLKIGMARLSTKPDVSAVDVMPTENPTTPKQTTTKKDSTTNKVKAPGRAAIKKATKKKSAKKASVKLKKVSGAKGYLVQISTSKKFKKVLVKKTTKSLKVTLTSKKLKGKKKLFVRAKAYKLNGKTKVYGKWSKVAKVKVK